MSYLWSQNQITLRVRISRFRVRAMVSARVRFKLLIGKPVSSLALTSILILF